MNYLRLLSVFPSIFRVVFLDAIAPEEVIEDTVGSVLVYCVPVVIIAVILILVVILLRKRK